MPEPGPEVHDRSADRPEDATDPLLWKLALGVADAHGPDDDGGACRNLGCAGHSWPCPAWNAAQHALQVARAGTGTAVDGPPSLPVRADGRSAQVGRSTDLVPPATRRATLEDGERKITSPAA